MQGGVWELPTAVEVAGEMLDIRSDFRAILDIVIALNDPDLDDREKARVILEIFYIDAQTAAKSLQEAVDMAMWFISCGENDPEGGSKSRSGHVYYDWQKDFKLIIAPINRVLGGEARSMEYLHWWSFISAYYEIGDCAFAHVVSIREKIKKGKKLEKWEREQVRENPELYKAPETVSEDVQAELDEIMGG